MKKKNDPPKIGCKGLLVTAAITMFIIGYMIKCTYEAGNAPRRPFDDVDALTAVEDVLKKGLNDPGSYDRDAWKAMLQDSASRRYKVVLDYRAKNGFGALMKSQVVAEVDSTWMVTFK